MTEKTTTVRFTDEDQQLLDTLQKWTGISSQSDMIRYALRVCARQAGMEGYGPARGAKKKKQQPRVAPGGAVRRYPRP